MPMADEHVPFLGRGWSFPPTFKHTNKTVEMVEDEQDIAQSLRILLSTIPGERLMKPEYGCDLHSMVFAQIDSHTEQAIIEMISNAILLYEPRITLHDVLIDSEEMLEGKLMVTLDYTIRKVNVRRNIVYPFYLSEGTNITDM